MDNRTLVFELNEFNRDLLLDGARAFGFKNLLWMYETLEETVTHTTDTYESDWLEPWVQWVNVHTGQPSSSHQVKHLGDVPDLKSPQIWETLSHMGKTTVVSGVLNGRRGDAQKCIYFLPDPWTFSENAFPQDEQALLNFPRYFAKNRIRPDYGELSFFFLQFLVRVLKSPRACVELLKHTPRVLMNLIRFKGATFVGFTFAEYLLAVIFLDKWKKTNPDLGIVFMNSLAHVQHYYWNGNKIQNNAEIKYCLYFVDSVLGFLRTETTQQTNCHLVVLNALSQMNTNHEKKWVSYRPKDHTQFLKLLGIKFDKVEALMSYDATVFFPNVKECKNAAEILRSLSIAKIPLLLVEEYPSQPNKLFYRLNFTDETSLNTHFKCGDKTYSFFSHFEKIVTRTAKHIQRASVFSTDKRMPKFMRNHEVYNYLLETFKP